jgi:hypothetical protein
MPLADLRGALFVAPCIDWRRPPIYWNRNRASELPYYGSFAPTPLKKLTTMKRVSLLEIGINATL